MGCIVVFISVFMRRIFFDIFNVFLIWTYFPRICLASQPLEYPEICLVVHFEEEKILRFAAFLVNVWSEYNIMNINVSSSGMRRSGIHCRLIPLISEACSDGSVGLLYSINYRLPCYQNLWSQRRCYAGTQDKRNAIKQTEAVRWCSG